MHKSIGKTLLVGGLVITSLVSQVGAVVAAPSDISESKFREHIENLIAANVVSGYSDGTFRPSNNVTRGEMAKFIVNAFEIEMDTTCSSFVDVQIDNPFSALITTLKCKGIIQGYSDGKYRPENYVTRGEVTKFVTKAFEYNGVAVDYTKEHMFYDVFDGDVFDRYIAYLTNIEFEGNKVISGFSDGSYQQSRYLTRGEMAKIIDISQSAYPLLKKGEVIGNSLTGLRMQIPNDFNLSEYLYNHCGNEPSVENLNEYIVDPTPYFEIYEDFSNCIDNSMPFSTYHIELKNEYDGIDIHGFNQSETEYFYEDSGRIIYQDEDTVVRISFYTGEFWGETRRDQLILRANKQIPVSEDYSINIAYRLAFFPEDSEKINEIIRTFGRQPTQDDISRDPSLQSIGITEDYYIFDIQSKEKAKNYLAEYYNINNLKGSDKDFVYKMIGDIKKVQYVENNDI